jgi:transposase
MGHSTRPPDQPRKPTPAGSSQPIPDVDAPPRLRRPDRQQLVVRPRTIDELVPEDHPVRAVWALVLRWDLTLFLQTIRARGQRPGRAATDPQLLIALWLYASIEGVGCGRQLARLCIESDPYKWLRGGVSLNYHTLNDFRVDHEEALDDLLTQMIAVLTQAQIVSVARIAQDGTRIRASAGTNSFGERETLEKHWEEARAHLEAVKQAAADPTLSAQQKAARERGARQRQERLEQALVELAKVEQAKAQQHDKPTKDHPARASSTDPEARMMRMPDGGTRPAFNLELATDCQSRAIVGVEATNAGSDAGQDAPMRDQVEERADEAIEEQLIDGGFISLEAIDRAAAEEVTVYMPVPKPRTVDVDPYTPKPTDSEAVAQWRQRMGMQATKPLYQQRSSTIETINGELKTERGLDRLRVRGLSKVQCAALWSVLAYNVVHFAPILLSG